jgi:hypothetical protein
MVLLREVMMSLIAIWRARYQVPAGATNRVLRKNGRENLAQLRGVGGGARPVVQRPTLPRVCVW